ncbi:MAG: YceI family protein [Actinomycetota bacterium]
MGTITTLIRDLDGLKVPVAGAYSLDPSHTTIGFTARHLMVTKVRGSFDSYEVDLHVAERIEESTLKVKIEAASIDTKNADRDAHLKSPDFLDVENHPYLEFVSTGVRHAGGDSWAVEGELSIVGVTRPVTLALDLLGETVDPWGNTRLLATASAEIDREDWGLTWNQVLEAGGVLVSKKILIEIEAQALPA